MKKEITVLEKNTVWYKKIRNGCWCIYRGNKKVSEHSTEKGAQEMCKSILTPH